MAVDGIHVEPGRVLQVKWEEGRLDLVEGDHATNQSSRVGMPRRETQRDLDFNINIHVVFASQTSSSQEHDLYYCELVI